MPQDFNTPALGNFRNHYRIVTPLEALTIKPFQCPQDGNLYPTHPSQSLKDYHVYNRAQFDRRQIDARDDECLNEHLFDSLRHARNLVAAWRADYNHQRLHSSLAGLTPHAYANRSKEDQNLNRANLN